jgi:EAL domain-containing protein (putative c-di-GMP-specific phosphodiesterase class I)
MTVSPRTGRTGEVVWEVAPHAGRSLESLIDELAADTAEMFAVALHFVRFPIVARHPGLRWRALRMLAALARRREAWLFERSDGDAVLVCRGIAIGEVHEIVGAIADLLGLPPPDLDPTTPSTLTTWFDLTQYEGIEALSAFAQAGPCRPVVDDQTAQAEASGDRPLTPKDLGRIAAALHGRPMHSLLRGQRALRVEAGGNAALLFTESYVSIEELKRTLAPGIDLFARPALFHFLTRILDACLLTALAQAPAGAMPERISLNLNLASLSSPEFDRLDRALGDRRRPVVEIQLIDAVADGEAYFTARNTLRRRGYPILLDAVGPSHLPQIDLARLDADFVKILWKPTDPCAASTPPPEAVVRAVRRIGRDKVILARVEAEEAVRWGLSCGIARFQGRYIDRLIPAMRAKGAICREAS